VSIGYPSLRSAVNLAIENAIVLTEGGDEHEHAARRCLDGAKRDGASFMATQHSRGSSCARAQEEMMANA
jgi:hypothetical protein